MKTITDWLEGICDAGRRLHARNLLAGGDGNLSVRLDDGRIAITPSGVSKASVAVSDLAYISPEGAVLSGRPSTERFMHATVYRHCPAARCVVHAHPPTAVAWTIARPELEELPSCGLPELILAAGRIPVVPYARPGTEAMGEVLVPFLPGRRLMILARHGALCWGESLEEACMGIERVEHVAQILKSAVELGGISELPPEELGALHEARRAIGDRIL